MIFGFFAIAISNVSSSMERLLTILAGAVWAMLFVGFFRTADSQ
jgi:hypothetical protein